MFTKWVFQWMGDTCHSVYILLKFALTSGYGEITKTMNNNGDIDRSGFFFLSHNSNIQTQFKPIHASWTFRIRCVIKKRYLAIGSTELHLAVNAIQPFSKFSLYFFHPRFKRKKEKNRYPALALDFKNKDCNFSVRISAVNENRLVNSG